MLAFCKLSCHCEDAILHLYKKKKRVVTIRPKNGVGQESEGCTDLEADAHRPKSTAKLCR
jgi:hypothetical protein